MPIAVKLAALDLALAAKDFPRLSQWWRSTFDAFVESERRQLVLRVGRRGGKSSSLCRFAVAFALAFDAKQIPPGDTGVVAFVSVNVSEAAQRLRTIKTILDALGVKYTKTDGGIELAGKPIAFKTFAATIGGVSGFTSILVVADEVAKWRNADNGANPAEEVLASIRPTLASQPRARIVLSSSAMGTEDAHAQAFAAGATEFQMVAAATSWEANPTLTEASTRALEPDHATWQREYANVPQLGGVNALDVEALQAACRPVAEVASMRAAFEIVIDASGGKHDTFVISVFGWVDEHDNEPVLWPGSSAQRGRDKLEPPTPRLVLAHMKSFEGNVASRMSTGDVADEIARIAYRFGACRVHGDQYGAWSWSSDLAKRGLMFEEHPWSAGSKNEAVLRLRQLLRERTLVIDLVTHGDPDDELAKLISEARAFTQTILPSGALSFKGVGSSHDDRIMTLLLASRVDAEGRLEGSPLHTPVYRNVIETSYAA